MVLIVFTVQNSFMQRIERGREGGWKAGSEAERTLGEEIQGDERSQACPRRTAIFIYSPLQPVRCG